MAIYRAHAPIGLDPLASADRTCFVRDGFSFWALVLGPLWLLGHRLWLALGVWLVGAAIVAAAISAGLLSENAAPALFILSAFYLGCEGRNLFSAALERSGAPLADVAAGADRTSAEHAFFARREERPNAPASTPAPAARAAAPAPSQTIIGLFPEAGG